MNRWTRYSIDYANQRNYLDELFRIYPTIPEGIRSIDQNLWGQFETAFNNQDNNLILSTMLQFDLSPIKDSYVAYLRHDPGAIARNPATVARLCGRLQEMGLSKIWECSTLPKETNRQMGTRFREWLHKGELGVVPVSIDEFDSSKQNAILDGSDAQLMEYAQKHFGYNRNKGLDLVARFNGKYVIGEAKFITDFGGHQYAQYDDAIHTIGANCKVTKVAILDGVLYIKSKNKMYNDISEGNSSRNIMSALVLRDFLYQL